MSQPTGHAVSASREIGKEHICAMDPTFKLGTESTSTPLLNIVIEEALLCGTGWQQVEEDT
jgi:hypothetical protein